MALWIFIQVSTFEASYLSYILSFMHILNILLLLLLLLLLLFLWLLLLAFFYYFEYEFGWWIGLSPFIIKPLHNLIELLFRCCFRVIKQSYTALFWLLAFTWTMLIMAEVQIFQLHICIKIYHLQFIMAEVQIFQLLIFIKIYPLQLIMAEVQ